MMTMQFRNAHELADAICNQSDPSGGKAAPAGSPEGQLHRKLRQEQGRLIKQYLEAFGHDERCKRTALPVGTVQECLG